MIAKIKAWLAGRDSKPHGIQPDGTFEMRPAEDIRIYPINEGIWGHHIHFTDYDDKSIKNTIYGFRSYPFKMPRPGDVLFVEMVSGKTAVYGLDNIKPQSNPPDMFFADAHSLDYLENIPQLKGLEANS